MIGWTFKLFVFLLLTLYPLCHCFHLNLCKTTFSFWIFLFELMILLQSEMPTLPPFKITNIGPSFKILFSVFQLLETLFKSHSLSTAPLSALKYGLPWWLSDKNPANAGDVGLIPGLGRWPGEGNGNPHQCSCLGTLFTEEPGGWQSMASPRVGLNLATEQQQQQHSNSTYFSDLALVSCWIWVQRKSEEERVLFSVSV